MGDQSPEAIWVGLEKDMWNYKRTPSETARGAENTVPAPEYPQPLAPATNIPTTPITPLATLLEEEAFNFPPNEQPLIDQPPQSPTKVRFEGKDLPPVTAVERSRSVPNRSPKRSIGAKPIRLMSEEEAFNFPPNEQPLIDQPPQSPTKVRFEGKDLPPVTAVERSRSVPNRSPKRSMGAKPIRLMSGPAQTTLSKMRKVSTKTFSPVDPKDENQERGNWSNPFEFFLSCLGYAVGLGNVWRFPFLVYRNGGGAFLIPYLLMLFLSGIPLMFMELGIGQYSSQGPLTVWKLAPLFKGIGITMVILSCICNVYYNVITGWALYYLVFSLRAILPWACCESPWATENCVSFVQHTAICGFKKNETVAVPKTTWTNESKFAADDYFHNKVLALSDSVEEIGTIHWPVVVALFAAWLIVFLVLMKGIKSFGKTVYFTSIFPYFVLTILLVRAAMEPGAVDGVLFYVTPKWEFLGKAGVWGDAAAQIFYSTGVCFGGVITLASYNNFRNNIYRDALIIGVGNSLTSIFSGFVVFSILGFLAHSQNTTIEAVATSGPGLTFIAYPQAVTLLSISPLWSTLFFIMLTTLALSSMFPTTENVITSIIDQFQDTLRPFKFWITMAVSIISFLFGLLICTNGGMYILQILDTYSVGYALLFTGLVETMVLAWRYGADRIIGNMTRMLGPHRSFLFWKYIWIFVTPTLLMFAIAFTLIQFKPVEYGSLVFPPWTSIVGWILTAISLSPILIYAVYKLVSFKRKEGKHMGWLQVLNYLTLPSDKWGPILPQNQATELNYEYEY